MIGSNLKQNKKGFTLVEVSVGVAIFGIILAATLGALANVLQTQRRALAVQSIQDNARFLFEFMAKEIRMGNSFSSPSSNELRFTNANGESIVYRLNNGVVERSNDGGLSFSPITSSEVNVSSLVFKTVGLERGVRQPQITIMAQMVNLSPKAQEQVSIEIQTSISPRRLDL